MDPREKLIEELLSEKRQNEQTNDLAAKQESEWGARWDKTEDLVRQLLEERGTNPHSSQPLAPTGSSSTGAGATNFPDAPTPSTGSMSKLHQPRSGAAGAAASRQDPLHENLVYKGGGQYVRAPPNANAPSSSSSSTMTSKLRPPGTTSTVVHSTKKSQSRASAIAGSSSIPTSQAGNQTLVVSRQEAELRLEDRAAMWALQHKRKLEARGKAKQLLEEEKMKECTFRPNTRIQKNSNQISAVEYEESPEEMFERLHHEADQRNRIREKAKSLLEESEVQELTFQPNLEPGRGRQNAFGRRTTGGPRSASAGAPGRWRDKPLRERVDEEQRKKAEHLLQTQMEVERRENATFRPKLSAASERMIQKKREEAQRLVASGQDVDGEAALFVQNAADRLYHVGKLKKQLEQQDGAGQMVMDAATAKLSAPKTDAIVEQSVFFQGPCSDFLVRQQTFEDARTQRRELRRKIQEADMKFQPTISKVSEALARTNVKRLNAEGAWQDRMSTAEQKEREQRQQMIAQEHLKDYTFQPKINPVSSKLVMNKSQVGGENKSMTAFSPRGNNKARSVSVGEVDGLDKSTASGVEREDASLLEVHPAPPAYVQKGFDAEGNMIPVHERLYKENNRRQEVFVQQLQEKEDDFKKNYTFRPEVRPKYRTKAESLYDQRKKENLLQNIAETQRRREIEIEKKKKLLEESEKKNCTFKPKRGTRPPKPQGPIIVNGLSRFLEQKEAARKKAEEEKAAQELAWGAKTKGLLEKRCGGVTVPRPFHLSETRDGRRMLRAEQEAEKRLQEYTFKPRTLEGGRTARLNRILDGQDIDSVMSQSGFPMGPDETPVAAR
ncbi:unnamed protein product [Amoebophrya sp. A120]|nr:unnamed protein product [Amoebophrya sp. A120]|eukprot:GSA120T00001656001.1